MKEYKGKVVEVFIPMSSNQNIIESNHIGFKVCLENDEVIEIVQEQNYSNVNIMKDSLVIIRKQIVDNKKFVDIELDEGVDYE